MLLDKQGDALGALAQFDAYLKSGSSDRALAEEARLGRAGVRLRGVGVLRDEASIELDRPGDLPGATRRVRVAKRSAALAAGAAGLGATSRAGIDPEARAVTAERSSTATVGASSLIGARGRGGRRV